MRGYYFWNNQNLIPSDKWGEFQATEGTVVYEVLRIVDGVPLFFDDHYQRLINSCRLIGQLYTPDKKQLISQFIELAKVNEIETGNISLKLIFSNSAIQPSNPTATLYFIPHSYPTNEQYQQGVSVGFLEAERNNPEAKVEQGVRKKANEVLKSGELFEVLLIDHDGLITEGSKSNMVFIKDNALYTCPLNKVLTGITLKKVIEIASTENISVIYEAVSLFEIATFDALFITGTSPKILPVANADNVRFDINNLLMRKLMANYDLLIEKELNDFL